MSKKDEIALKHLCRTVELLQRDLRPSDQMPHAPDVSLGYAVANVMQAMFAYKPAAIANAMRSRGLCPTCVVALTNNAALPPMSYEAAVDILKQVVRGDLVGNHIEAELARESLGSEASKIEANLERQHRAAASSRDYMTRRHRVAGSAFSGRR